MSTAPQTQQDQQVEATIQRIDFDQSSGWYTIHTDQGEFSTKFPEPAQEAQQYLNQRVALVYQQAAPRQGRNGQWYQSRYLRRIVASYAPVQQQLGGQPMPQPPPVQPQGWTPDAAPRQGDERETRIMRQTAAKLAVATMPLIPSEHRTFKNQVMVAEAWLRYFVSGPPADLPESPLPEPPSGPSDDIPW